MTWKRLLLAPMVVLSVTGGGSTAALEADASGLDAFRRTCFQPYPETEEQLIRRHFAQAIAVFSGEVRTLTLERAEIRVLRVWKGTLGAEVVLPTGFRDMESGIISHLSESFTFKQGETYLLFGRGNSTDGMTVSVCEPNGLLKDSARKVAILDRLVKGGK